MIKLSKILLLIILIIILTTSSIFADTSLPMPNDYAIVDAFIVNCFNNDDKSGFSLLYNNKLFNPF